jgi:hypothetical protein
MSFIYLYCLRVWYYAYCLNKNVICMFLLFKDRCCMSICVIYTWKSCTQFPCLNNAQHSCLNNTNLWNNIFHTDLEWTHVTYNFVMYTYEKWFKSYQVSKVIAFDILYSTHLWVKTQLGYPLWNIEESLLGHSNSPFSSFFLWTISDSPFFLISNEIILFQILYQHLEYLFFSLVKVKIIKCIQCGPCFYQWPKIPTFWKKITL